MTSSPQGMPAEVPDDPTRNTSDHVRAAVAGGRASLDWLIRRFRPLLEAQARYRLHEPTLRTSSPEDAVDEAWLKAMNLIRTFEAPSERPAAAFLRFVSKILLNICNAENRRALRRRTRSLDPEAADFAPEPTSPHSGVVTRASRRELSSLLRDQMQLLSDEQREVLILRGLEDHSFVAIAQQLGGTPDAIRKRYDRALACIRGFLPEPLGEELAD